MLRILILCILLYVQPAVFRNIEKHYDREYEKGIIKKGIWDNANALHNAQARSEGYSTESGDDRKPQDIADYNNTYYNTDSAENHLSIVKLFDDMYKPSPAINNRKSSDDSTTRQKEENVTIVLLRIADAIEGLNKNLKGIGKDYPNRIPLHAKTLYRHKRDVSNDASNKTVAIQVEVIDGIVPAQEESHAKDAQDSALKGNEEIKVEDKSFKGNIDKKLNIPIARTAQDKESPTITKDKLTKDSDGASENKTISNTEKNAAIEKAAPFKDTAVKDVNNSSKENITDAIKIPALRSGKQNDENISSEENTSIETKVRSESDKTEDVLKDITVDNNSSPDVDSLDAMENSYALDNSSATIDTPEASVNIKVNISSGRRSYHGESSSSPRIKEKLLVYLEDMFDDLANKVQPLTRVKIALSPDNSYRIGYIVANIDTLEIKLKRLKRNMYLNKDYWDDDKMIDLFDNLRVTTSVVSSLMNTLNSYLAVPLL